MNKLIGILLLTSYSWFGFAIQSIDDICSSPDAGIQAFVSALKTGTDTSKCESAFRKASVSDRLNLIQPEALEGEVLNLTPLAQLPNVKYLAVWGKYELRALEVVSNLHHLESLGINGAVSISEGTPSEFPIPKSLTQIQLKLSGNRFIEPSTMPKSLHGLTIATLSITGKVEEIERAFALALEIRGLKGLEIDCGSDSNKPLSLEAFKNSGLTSLKISSCPSVNLHSVGSIGSLKELQWYSWPTSSLDALAGLTSLEKLDLGSSKSLKDLKAISGMISLKSLSLGWCALDDESLKPLSGLTELTSLNINNNKIAGPGLKYLAALTKITWLDLDETEIGDDGLQYFKYWPNTSKLAHLRLFQNTGDPLTGKTLHNLSHLQGISYLQICFNKIDDMGLEILASSLPNLTSLIVRGNEYTNDGLRSLAKLSKLTGLVLSSNKHITSAGLVHLSDLLNLEELYLQSTKIKKEDPEVVQLGASRKNLKIYTKMSYFGDGNGDL